MSCCDQAYWRGALMGFGAMFGVVVIVGIIVLVTQ